MTQELRDWSGHVRSWRDQEETPVHMVRYEDLLTDTEREFRTALGTQPAGEAKRISRSFRVRESFL